MINIKQVHKEFIQDFIDIYDSANHLFDDSEKALGTYETFDRLMEDESYLLCENNVPAAFVTCRLCGNYIKITGLYVKMNHQNKGYGRILLKHVEDKNHMTADAFVLSISKNAPWAEAFYKSCGYSSLSKDNVDTCGYNDISFDEWSIVMHKPSDKKESRCSCHNQP